MEGAASSGLDHVKVACAPHPGVRLHLTDESVGRQAQFGDPRVPDVFNQRADLISFGDVVRRTAETHTSPHNPGKRGFFSRWASLVEQQFAQLHVEGAGNGSKGPLSPLQVSHLLQLL